MLSIAVLINIGFTAASFVGHSVTPFKTLDQCQEYAAFTEMKARDKLGGAILKWEAKCIETKLKYGHSNL